MAKTGFLTAGSHPPHALMTDEKGMTVTDER